jgi:hypothetical protein
MSVFIALGFSLLFGLVSVLVLNVSCGLTGPLYWNISRDSSQCGDQVRNAISSANIVTHIVQYVRWQITTGLDIASEVVMLLLPIDMIWSLQMNTWTKFSVLSRFTIRIP